jgi:two-component system chemotaxis response regulator CheY
MDGIIKPELRVLFIDDNNIVLISMMATLQDLGLKNIFCTDDVKQAVKEIFTGDYDLILTDINMPILDGYQIAQYVRQWESENNKKLPCYALTGSDINHLKADKRDYRIFDGIFIKPVDEKELMELMASL